MNDILKDTASWCTRVIYADTDFLAALTKESDWLKSSAKALLTRYKGQIWISPATLIELMLLPAKRNMDMVRMLTDALEVGELRGGNAGFFLVAARCVKVGQAGVFDALHAAFCGRDCPIISSDRVFDRLGLKRIALEKPSDATASGNPR